jgi:hypothetical protein
LQRHFPVARLLLRQSFSICHIHSLLRPVVLSSFDKFRSVRFVTIIQCFLSHSLSRPVGAITQGVAGASTFLAPFMPNPRVSAFSFLDGGRFPHNNHILNFQGRHLQFCIFSNTTEDPSSRFVMCSLKVFLFPRRSCHLMPESITLILLYGCCFSQRNGYVCR